MSRILLGLRCSLVMVGALAAMVAGCGSESDPFAHGNDADIDINPPGKIDAGGEEPRADASPGGAVRCAKPPARVIVLGDSITDCSVVGGDMSADCVSKMFFDYVKANYGPDATYVNVAVGGAQTKGLTQQLAQVSGGAGHVLVMVYVGGNDLAPYIFQSDAAAMQAYENIMPGIIQNWKDLFTFFDDKTRFPDGATIIMNNQYNPFDDCTAPPYNLSQTKSNLLHMFNIVLGDLANEHFLNTVLVDQYQPYLGHGHHYNVAACPHYKSGVAPFMKDLIHANAAGNKALAAQLEKGADRVFTECTP